MASRTATTQNLRKLEAKTEESKPATQEGLLVKVVRFIGVLSELGVRPKKEPKKPVRWQRFYEGRWVYEDTE